MKAGHKVDAKELEKDIVRLIRHDIGPVASFKVCHVV